MVAYHPWERPSRTQREQDELIKVRSLAKELKAHLMQEHELIAKLHVHDAQSKVIQQEVGRLLTDRLGFAEEVVVTPDTGVVTRARADFFYRLPTGGGIIAEVERGGTTANNHDLKDLWKAHLATDVHHLFLIVPQQLFKKSGEVRELPYLKVVRRMSAFFQHERRYVDVLSVHIFGY